MKEWVEIVEKLEQVVASELSFALATVIQVEGSSYRKVGARMLILEDGTWVGSISGGCLEGDMLKKAKMAIHQQTIKVITYDTRDEDPFALGIGLGCNGKIDILIDPNKERIIRFKDTLKQALNSEKGIFVEHNWDLNNPQNSFQKIINQKEIGLKWEEKSIDLIEFIPPQPRIWVFGHQFDSHRLIGMSTQLAWKVFWVGNILKMDNQIKKLCFQVLDWSDKKDFQIGDNVVVMTHDLERDVQICEELIGKEIAYWGMLGPKKRIEKIREKLDEKSIQLSGSIHSPIGLDIGAEGPDEIAVSIISEIIAVRNKREGGFLIKREGNIH